MHRRLAPRSPVPCLALALALAASAARADGPVGYYRQPAIHGDTVVFVAEGDLWKVPAAGGVARRLTSHPAEESRPAISPDGSTVAFVAHYEGPSEVYTLPLDGGRPVRWTYGSDGARVVGWTPDGDVLVSTDLYSTLPDWQLVRLKVAGEGAGSWRRLPLAQAADGAYDADGATLFFTRLPFQGSHTRRYRGGTAQSLWRFAEGSDAEATPLTADYPGTSKRPMVWQGRVYFVSDRDGTMNLWSMDEGGGDLRQHTHHAAWDVQSPSLDGGRIVYQLGADLRLYSIATDSDRTIPITLATDLDQTREHWIDEPITYLTAVHPSPDGDRLVLTARGRVFVAPRHQGRLVEATHQEGVRYRGARFLPDGKQLLTLSDRSGEVELWTVPADGVGNEEQLTDDADVLRWDAVPSPDGRWIAHYDKNQRLWLYDVTAKKNRKIDESKIGDFAGLAWSPDSKWLAYQASADNLFSEIRLYGVDGGELLHATGDRFDSSSPAWSRDGKWLYFLSDRNLESLVGSPWGSYQPEPFLGRRTKLYQLALTEGLRSPFAPDDELHPATHHKKRRKDKEQDDDKDRDNGERSNAEMKPAERKGKPSPAKEATKKPPVEVKIDAEGLAARLEELPVPPGDYDALTVNDDTLFWLRRPLGADQDARQLVALEIDNLDPKVETVAEKVAAYELTADGETLFIRQDDDLYLVDAEAEKAKLTAETKVDLNGWQLSIEPRQEWRQMFIESWRLERDYFYDTGMHGVDWKGMLERFLPLVDRVTSRQELSDLMSQMVSELAALHTFVRDGDTREGPDDVEPASLGAVLRRDPAAGGYRVEHLYASDPDEPDRRSPLARPGVDVHEGDVVTQVNGTATLDAADLGELLRGQAERQVRLEVQPVDGGSPRQVIARPISLRDADDLRYHEWEYTRRLAVERLGGGSIGYVHLRAMGRRDFAQWARDYYPVFNRQGLIIDVRHNRGGNIDSWILGRLLRKAWFYWSARVGHQPLWNMQYAFRGHVAVLCDSRTASDGEAFTEGIKRLGLGKVFGTRTWGGEIWLSSSNTLVDRGIATAAEFGVYGPEGDWLIEGWGVEPDVTVDNPPHATFLGKDTQLEAAIEYLKQKIAEEPVPEAPTPEYPDKSFRYPGGGG